MLRGDSLQRTSKGLSSVDLSYEELHSVCQWVKSNVTRRCIKV